METYVYALHEEASWDYEPMWRLELFHDFETALKVFDQKVKNAKEDASGYDGVSVHMNRDDAAGSADYEMYADEDYTRLHHTITIQKIKVK